MNMNWIEPKIPEIAYGKPPSAWIGVLVSVGYFIVFFILAVLGWKEGKPVINAGFFVRILLVPALAGGLISSLIYFRYEDLVARIDLWNNLCRRIHASWRWWAQERIAIVGSVTLTPERDLGVRMLGLEGAPPANAGKTLALALDRKEGSSSRVQQVLEELVTPFASYMTAFAGRQRFRIIVQSDREADLNDLRALLRKLVSRNLDFIELIRVPEGLDMGLVEGWLCGNEMSDYCLVLAWQLHVAGKEPLCSEAAVALLFASRTVIRRSDNKLKPDAWVFRPAAAAMDGVFDTLKTMLAAEQAPVERIRHLWLTHVPGQGKHATLTAVKDAGLELATHDLDFAIGLPGPINTLLLQALSSRMVQHGQGTQLVATSYKGGVMLNLVGIHVAPVEDVEEKSPHPLSISFMLMTGCAAALFVLICADAEASVGWYVGIFAGFIVLQLAHAVFSLIRRGQVEHEFYKALPW